MFRTLAVGFGVAVTKLSSANFNTSRNLFSVTGEVSTPQLMKALRYVRRNLAHLDSISDEELKEGKFSFVA